MKPGSGVVSLERERGHALLCEVLLSLDTDCDRRLTVEDEQRLPYVARAGEVTFTLAEVHQAAQLVQELVVALRTPGEPLRLDSNLVLGDPATFLAHRIRHHHWEALTRRIDADPERLARAASDAKLGTGMTNSVELCPQLAERCGESPDVTKPPAVKAAPRRLHVYYPSADAQAREVFEGAGAGGIEVTPLPEKASADWVLGATRSGSHGLLTLALSADGTGRPFVVPGGRFNEMYGWDSFFILWGLVQAPEHRELARAMIDNQAYEIVHYGKILNANRTYYLTRSQPPFFTSALVELWKHLEPTDDNRRWLAAGLAAALREYRTVWSSAPRRLPLCEKGVCLARYFSEGSGEPPEVEAGHFAWFYQRHAVAHAHCRAPTDPASREPFLACTETLARRYRSGALRDAAIERFLLKTAAFASPDTTTRSASGPTTENTAPILRPST